nr:anion permease [Micrococcus luteus]
MRAPEAKVLAVFVLAALAWITVPLISEYVLDLTSPLLSDAAIAMVVGLILFLLPAGGGPGAACACSTGRPRRSCRGRAPAVRRRPGPVRSVLEVGLSTWLGEQSRPRRHPRVGARGDRRRRHPAADRDDLEHGHRGHVPARRLRRGPGTGVAPLMLAAPVALAATCAFMLPVATPPNAIAYGSGYVSIGQMVKGGVWLNIIAAVLISIASMTLLVWVFGL